jgi:hypothetical protein
MHFKKIITIPLRLLLLAVGVFVVYFNVHLYKFGQGTLEEARQAQLRHLQHVLRTTSAASDMQNLYPEGFVFLNAIYGLAQCDLAAKSGGLPEIDFAIKAIESDQGKSVFPEDLPLPHGAFYKGWLNYLRGKRLSVARNDSILETNFRADCANIAAIWKRESKTYLESYHGQTWPADNVVCLAALALHDRLYVPLYQNVIADWINKVKAHLDPDTGLIPHSYNHSTETMREPPRGSSQSLIFCFLNDVDSAFAADQYTRFKQYFLAHRMGLPGIREYPKGTSGGGDIDSGPVVFGIGGVASIVGIRAVGVMEGNTNSALHLALLSGVDGLLFPFTNKGKRSFLGGKLPVLDAFMAWAMADLDLLKRRASVFWRLPFHLWSLLILFLLWLVWRRA